MNWPIEKSLAAEAELPYLPKIPTPTLATWIIPTSFPPSPIAKTIPYNFYFTKFTIMPFSLGVLLQNITDDTLSNIFAFYGFYECINFDIAAPSIITLFSCFVFVKFWVSAIILLAKALIYYWESLA